MTLHVRASTTRLHSLDALRGTAAIAVLISHIAPSLHPIEVLRSWYAVDLFFIISGVVLCRTYEPRFRAGLTVPRFMMLRYLRLYPLFGFGLLLGIMAELFAPLEYRSLLSDWDHVAAIASGILILPSPTASATPEIIPLNPVGWSLFFELAINLVYAVFWRRLGNTALLAVVIFWGLDLLWLSEHHVSFGGVSWPTFWAGLPRIAFSFFIGVLIGRVKQAPPRASRWAWVPVAIFLALLIVPWQDADLRDTVIMMLTLPPLVWWALSLEPRSTRFCSWLGVISYPVYAVHYPLYRLLGLVLALTGTTAELLAPWSGVLFIAVVIALCSLLDRWFDAPLRRVIGERLSKLAWRSRASVVTI